MTKTTETVVVEEFDESGRVIKRTTTTKEITQQNDYGLTGNWWEHQPTVTYRGYTGDTITTTTTTANNCDGQTALDGFNVNEGDTTCETSGY